MRYIFTIALCGIIQVLSANTLNNNVRDTLPTNSVQNSNLSIGASRGLAIREILSNILPPYTNCIDERFSIYYTSRGIFDSAIIQIAFLKAQLLKYDNVDYIPQNIYHANGLLEHLVTIYNYNIKTKQRFIIGQISFEFDL